MIDFKEIVGHEKPIQILKNIIKFNRISHSYLFTGKEGIGKKLAAIAFGKAINCANLSKDQDPCNQCSSCLKIDKNMHPDFNIISPLDSVIKINQIREIKSNIYLQPLESKKKIYLIDNADRMTIEASNSLLKILEEPPEFAILILITAFSEVILPTILSRCCQLSFKTLKIEHQREILKKNLPSYKEKELENIMQLSYGCPGKALFLAGHKQKLTEKNQYIDLLARIKPEEMIDCIFRFDEKIFSNILDSFQEFIEIMFFWFRDILFLKIGLEKNKLFFQDRINEIQKYANHYSKEKIIFVLEYLADIPEKLEKHINPKILLENIFIQLGD